MLQLLLLRHAKAEQGDAATADGDRRLSLRGIEQSTEIGRAMVEAGYRPATILCSSSRRTRDTLLGVLPHLLPMMPPLAQVRLQPQLYNGTDRSYFELLRAIEGVSSVLVIGHNPTIHQVANTLSGDGPVALRTAMAAKYPTAALAVIEFDVDRWSEIEPQRGRLTAFIEPAA